MDQDAEQERRHRQNQKRLESIQKSQSELKVSVDRVHRIDVWILIAGAIAALGTLILIALEIAGVVGGRK